MKLIERLPHALFVVAGAALMWAPAHATPASPAAFVPTRFTASDSGTAGKPDVVLIPGLSSSKSVWDGEAKLLAPNYRLHILQIDGFAGAAAGANASGPMLPGIVEELHAYIAANKMHPIVIGHSLGGLLALLLADKYPLDARKLVIVDSLPFYGVLLDPSATVASLQPQVEIIKSQLGGMPADQFAAMQPMMAAQLVKSPDGQALVAASSLASDRAVAMKAMVEDLNTDIRGDVASIKVPTLVLYPFDPTMQKDEARVNAIYETAYKAMPNVKLVRIDDSRHFIMYDQPAKMDAAIEPFLKQAAKP